VSPITAGLKKVSDGVASLAKTSATDNRGEDAAALGTGLARLRPQSSDSAASAATTVLNPFNGQPPGYNNRGPNGASPKGPALPPSPNGGSGNGGAALEYQAGRPGNYTRDIAVDITELQNTDGNHGS